MNNKNSVCFNVWFMGKEALRPLVMPRDGFQWAGRMGLVLRGRSLWYTEDGGLPPSMMSTFVVKCHTK